MAIAKSGKRLAFLGFSGVWRASWQLDQLNQTKVVLITDRPVYRPDQKVEFKFWVRPVSYDLTPEQSKAFARQKFTVQLTDPMGVEVWKKPFTTQRRKARQLLIQHRRSRLDPRRRPVPRRGIQEA
jgi:alpha-2-macroglobulin